MKLQAAMTRVKRGRTESSTAVGKASRQKIRTLYVGVDEALYDPEKAEKIQQETEALLEEAMTKLAKAYDLKVNIMRANVENDLDLLIQEMDFLKSLCSLLTHFHGAEQKSDPHLAPGSSYRGSGENLFVINESMYDVSWVDSIYEGAQQRIKEIQDQLEEQNHKIEVEIPASGPMIQRLEVLFGEEDEGE